MVNPAYSFALRDLFTNHGSNGGGLVQDVDDQPNAMLVESLVASGDCFVTLATESDKISELLTKPSNKHVSLELDKLTRMLLYLQQHYKVVKKTA